MLGDSKYTERITLKKGHQKNFSNQFMSPFLSKKETLHLHHESQSFAGTSILLVNDSLEGVGFEENDTSSIKMDGKSKKKLSNTINLPYLK